MTERELVSRVRERLVASGAPPAGPAFQSMVRDEASLLVDQAALADLSRGVAAELSGAGPLDALLALEGTTDVLVNSPSQVWLDRGRGLEQTPVRFRDEAAVRRLAQRLAAGADRRLDDATPFVDAALPDGTRLHAVIPPVSPNTLISLRVLGRRRFALTDLVEPELLPVLEAIIAARLAFLISGGTGTGKTTLLGALLARAEFSERLLLIEDAREIVVDHPHVVRLLCRAPNVEGAGAVELRDLVRQSLRMRPDRIVVGEFRGAEMAELLIALNTGHDGGAATIHANSALDLPARLAALGALGGLDATALQAQVTSALDVVIHLQRAGGLRRIQTIALLAGADGSSHSVATVVPVWTRDGSGVGQRQHPGTKELARLLQQRGVAVPEVLR